MTMTSVGWMRYPENDGAFSAGSSSQNFDASTDLYAIVFRVPATGTIANVHYRTGTISSPSMTLRIELRTVDAATGLPNAAGTLYGSSTSITTTSFAANTNYTAAVNCTGATVGDLVALVFDISAFTSGSFNLVVRSIGILANANFPYAASNTTGATAVTTSPVSGFALEYSGSVFYPFAPATITATSASATVSNSGVTRRGNRVRPPVKMRAIGIWAQLDADGDCLLQLRLQSDDSILATATLDKDVRGSASNAPWGDWLFDAGATVTLTAGTDYYVLVTGNSATNTTCYQVTSIPSNAMLDQLSGGKFCYGSSYNAGYTDVDTSRYGIGLIVDQFDDGAGGGGGGANRAALPAGLSGLG